MTDNEKILINDSGTQKSIRLTFPNHEINDIENDRVYLDGMSLEESLFDGESLTFGKCNASLFKIRVADFTEDIKDAEMDAYVTFTNPDTTVTSKTVSFGKYIIQSVERTSDRRWRDITAVDFMSKFDVDIADWYNTTLYPTSATTHTISEIRTALCQHIGVTQASVTLINDSLIIGKTIEPSSLSARELLQNICEVNACFGHFDWNGTLQYISLLPRSNSTNREEITTYKNIDYEDYEVEAINSVGIQQEDGSLTVYYTIPQTEIENRYVIIGNVLLFAFNQTQLTSIATTICNAINGVYYSVNDTQIFSHVYMDLGQQYSAETSYFVESEIIQNTIVGYVLKRTISGIQSMFSTLSSIGSEYQPKTQSHDILSELTVLQGKYAKYKRELDGLEIEFGDYAEQTDTRISVTEEQVAINVQDINTLQRQVSGEMETYTGDEQPLPSNTPANSWNDAEKARRIGTKYYCTDGTAWQWMSGMLVYGSNALIYGTTKLIYYYWKQIADSGISEALQIAHEALQEANDVSQTLLTDYETTEDAHSYVQQTKQEILNGVSNTYATQTALQTVDGKFANVYTKRESDSLVEQTAEAINQSVSQNYSTKAEVGNLKVGGENLILNSLDYVGDTHFMYNSHLIYNNRLLIYNQKKLCY